jgi:uncharacterized membrane protein
MLLAVLPTFESVVIAAIGLTIFGLFPFAIIISAEINTLAFELMFFGIIFAIKLLQIYVNKNTFINYKIITPYGFLLLEQIKGFQRYLQTAEQYRTEFSNPQNAERIFTTYLPYAFAIDMQNKWFDKFEGIISSATMQEITQDIGDRNFVSSGLSRTISSASSQSSSSSSGSSSSGSGGGGSSGGGRGGGGGGGR